MKHILIVGASSAIATACARRWAEEGARYYLLGRTAGRLQDLAQDLQARGAATDDQQVQGLWPQDRQPLRQRRSEHF